MDVGNQIVVLLFLLALIIRVGLFLLRILVCFELLIDYEGNYGFINMVYLHPLTFLNWLYILNLNFLKY